MPSFSLTCVLASSAATTVTRCGCCGGRAHTATGARASLLAGRHRTPAVLRTTEATRARIGRDVVTFVAHADGCSVEEEEGVECEDYLPLGLARCYLRDADNKLQEHYVIEPVTAGSLESLVNGAKTTYEEVYGATLGEALAKENNILPVKFHGATYCDDFDFRAKCSTRTWLRPHPQENLLDIVPAGEMRGEWNMDKDNKRILNFENVVNDDDNIKQDMSIDVYGRKDEDEEDEIAKAYNA